MTRSAPGFLLGLVVVAGTVIAALAVRPRAGRMIFPVPVLRNRSFGGQPVCYLDSSATSQTPDPVIDAMTSYYTHSRASR